MAVRLAVRLQERKVKNVLATGAEVLMTASPGCIIQLVLGSSVQGPSDEGPSPGGMMAFVKVASIHDVPPGASTIVRVNSERIALFNLAGEIVALGNVCPHAGESLGEGTVEGDIVICPGHGWEYDLHSGACMTIPGESVARFPVIVEGDTILVDLGE